MPSIFSRVVSNDPEYARPLLDQLAGGSDLPGRQNMVIQMVRDWSMREPEAALDWLKQQPAGEERAEMVSAVIEMMGFSRSPYFSTGLGLLPEGPARSRCIATYAQHLAYIDPASALVWIKENAPPELVASLTPELHKSMVAHLAKTDLAAATHWLDTEIAARPPGADLGDLLASAQAITSRLARQDPEALMRWAEKTPDPGLRQKAYQAVGLDVDMETFGSNTSTPLSHRRRADLLAKIADPQVAAGPLSTLLGNWLERDYEAARDWIEGHEALSPEAAAKLLSEKSPDRYEITLGHR